MSLCCSLCFADEFVAAVVEARGRYARRTCDYCGRRGGKKVDPETLKPVVRPAAREFFTPTSELTQGPHIDAFDEGSQLGELLNDTFGMFDDEVGDPNQLAVDLLYEPGDGREGEPPEFSSDELYSHRDDDWIHRSDADFLSELRLAVKRYGHALHLGGPPFVGRDRDAGEAWSVLRQSLETVTGDVHAQSQFWRARIGVGHTGNHLRPPPPDRVTPGRANLQGQPVLYVADADSTAVAEVRPSVGDVVSVGEFRLERDARIVDLATRIRLPSPFENLERYSESRARELSRRALGGAFGKPVRTGDAPAEYLLTQYVALMIRSLGFDGFSYPSSQSANGGTNWAFFDPGIAVQTGTSRNVSIAQVEYRTRPFVERHG